MLSAVAMAMQASNELNEKQSAFRRELFSILGKEDYNPDIDKDGDIMFEHNGAIYYVAVDNRWTEPFLVTIYNIDKYSEDYSKDIITNCIPIVGQSKMAKLYCTNSSYYYECEIFCYNSNVFRNVFKAMIQQLNYARADVKSIINAGVGDLDMSKDKTDILNRGKQFYQEGDYTKSQAVFKLLANAGYTPAYRYMGLSYENGLGVQRSATKMVWYYEKALEAGDYWSAYKLANHYYDAQDYTKAYNLFLKCASNENEYKSDAMYRMGEMQEKGMGTEMNLAQAIQSYRKSVQYATRIDCNARLALIRLNEPIEKPSEFTDATKTMLMGLNTGKALYQMGEEYELGLNKRFVSLPKAYAYYKAASDKDYTRAYIKMGEIYMSKYYPFGDKMKSDRYYQKAFKVYSQQTDHNGEACFELGNMYKNGYGIAQDLDQAKFFFKKGAILNDKNASYEYGLICKTDLEYPEAFTYFKQSAEKGHCLAMYELAKLYEEGLGTETNRSKAIEWYKKSAECNESIASESRKALKRLGSNDEKL